LRFLRSQSVKFPYAVITTLFKFSVSQGQKEKIVLLVGCPVAPRLWDTRNMSHVLLIGTNSLGLKSLRPFLLTRSDAAFKSRERIRLCDEFFAFPTAQNYMTIEVMKFYVNSMIDPYVKSLRDHFSGQRLNIFLVAGNHGPHTKTDILALLQRTGVVPIWLPLHSSHFRKPWVMVILGSFRKCFGNLQRPEAKSQFEGKTPLVPHS
jgi:hypothetical protein